MSLQLDYGLIDNCQISALVEKTGRITWNEREGLPKTTFTVCSFWMADALWGAGRKNETRELFSSVIHKANHVGLLFEDMDPETGEVRGNFSQTYSHASLISTAWRTSQSWDNAF